MIKRWINSRGPALTVAPNGDWVKHDDYIVLEVALREALDGWEEHADHLSGIFADDLKRIDALRAKFLGDK
jgi:hypothetical protein